MLAAPWIAAPAVAQVDPAPYRTEFDACLAQADGAQMLQACMGQASTACQTQEVDGDSTIGLMFCALMERDLWDEALNIEYQDQIAFAADLDRKEREYGNANFAIQQESLRNAQRAWIPFRDAQCTLEYAQWGSGSMRNVAAAQCNLRMTADRVIYLKTARDAMRGD